MSFHKDIPKPRPSRTGARVGLSASSAAKVALYQELRDRGITKAALGGLLKLHSPQVERLLDLNHSSDLKLWTRPCATLGNEAIVTLKPAAQTFPEAEHYFGG